MRSTTQFKKHEAVAVANTSTLLVTLNVQEFGIANVSFTVATHDLAGFAIKAKNHQSAPVQTLKSAAGDFTAPAGLLKTASGDLTTQAAGSTGAFIMDVAGFYEIEIYATSGNASGSTVSIYAGVQ